MPRSLRVPSGSTSSMTELLPTLFFDQFQMFVLVGLAGALKVWISWPSP